MQRVAPMSSFPDRLRPLFRCTRRGVRSEHGRLLNYLKKASLAFYAKMHLTSTTLWLNLVFSVDSSVAKILICSHLWQKFLSVFICVHLWQEFLSVPICGKNSYLCSSVSICG